MSNFATLKRALAIATRRADRHAAPPDHERFYLAPLHNMITVGTELINGLLLPDAHEGALAPTSTGPPWRSLGPAGPLDASPGRPATTRRAAPT